MTIEYKINSLCAKYDVELIIKDGDHEARLKITEFDDLGSVDIVAACLPRNIEATRAKIAADLKAIEASLSG